MWQNVTRIFLYCYHLVSANINIYSCMPTEIILLLGRGVRLENVFLCDSFGSYLTLNSSSKCI